MMQELGRQALVSIFSHIIFIIITWQVLQAVRYDHIFKKTRTFEAKIVIILLTIVIGSTVSNFFLDLINWTQQALYLF
ncbi:putative integral membrane protein (TIGR02327 family) [Natronobacillus azotifigens]|uniref:DUF1146 family protein n=1 Tax=Natronobacillus azotifigens TaxID=472978 RepID=A0A9J6RDA6_9BACI|nr:DUF1146 family protein [Natronobacillus azotifigens]MCZ0703664.1 DUF1146 family protein [Natronobacillus azotifigens]